jgi:hypothetical protein
VPLLNRVKNVPKEGDSQSTPVLIKDQHISRFLPSVSYEMHSYQGSANNLKTHAKIKSISKISPKGL